MAGGVIGLVAVALVSAAPAAARADAAADLADRIGAALAAEAELAEVAGSVTVTVDDAGVRLGGTVRLYRQKLLVERTVRAVAGETPIRYDLHVVPVLPASDREVERHVVALSKLDRFQGSEMEVAVAGGDVVVRAVFHDPRDVVFLIEQIAAIEGVRSIEIDARFPV